MASTSDIDKIVTNKEAMELIVSSKDYLAQNIRNDSNYYTNEIYIKFLNSSVITETAKYEGGLPCYLFKNGTTGFPWSEYYDGMYTEWCGNRDPACRQATISVDTALTIKDDNTSKYFGGALITENLDITPYNKIVFDSYTFNYTNSGVNSQKIQQEAKFSVDSTVLLKINYESSPLSGTFDGDISTIDGLKQIKIAFKAGGLPSYKSSISIEMIYMY